MKKFVVLLLSIVLSVQVFALDPSLPEPAIYLPFDAGSWTNAGTAGVEDPNVTEKNGLVPSLSYKSGIVGGCLDQSDFPGTAQPILDPLAQPGQVIYGVDDLNDLNDTPMELAMDDMASFTIMGWFKGQIGSGSGARIISRMNYGNEEPESNSFQLFADRYYSGKMKLIVNGYESTAMGESFYDNSPSEWTFFAVTYDGLDTFANVQWYKGYDDGTDSVVKASGFCSLSGGVATHGRHNSIHFGNSGVSGAWPWSGLLDEIRIFVSKTDGSGVLSEADIRAFKAAVYEAHCGDENHPYPQGDFNGDCVVDMSDVLMLSNGWLSDTRPVVED